MRLFAFLHKHWRIPVALHVANACRDMARLQPGPELPFPTVWDDAGRDSFPRSRRLHLSGLASNSTVFHPWVLPPAMQWFARDLPWSRQHPRALPYYRRCQWQHARLCCLTRPCLFTKWRLTRTSWLFCDSTSTPRSGWDLFHVATASHLHSRHGMTMFNRRDETSTWESMSSPGASWISTSQGFSSTAPKTSCTLRLAHSFRPSGASSDALCTT